MSPEPPAPDTSPPHRLGSLPYVKRTGSEDLSVWRSANVFFPCVSVRLDGARGLPPALDLFCEVQAGPRVRLIPLLLSQADLEAGGGGRIDGGQLSERVDLLMDGLEPESVELRLMVKAQGPMWSQRSLKFVGHLSLRADDWTDPTIPSARPADWVPVCGIGDGREVGQGEGGSFSPVPHTRGPALLVRCQCFGRADLFEAETRARLFELYSANGQHLTAEEFDGLLLQVAHGHRSAEGAFDLTTLGPVGAKVGCCRSCLGQAFAAMGYYKDEHTLLEYLMFYHTLLWVCCRPPGEEHILILHRFLFVLLSMGFNLFVVVLFTATDYSFVEIHCPANLLGQISCSPLEMRLWETAQVFLVAVVDTAFWPLLKRIFYFFESLWSGRARRLPDVAWLWLRRGLFLLLLGAGASTFISAARHPQQLSNVLNEFFTTYPAARITETFKLLSLWAILVEFGLPTPPPAGVNGGASPAASAKGSRKGSRRGSRVDLSSGDSGDGPAVTAASEVSDDKRVPLLSAQH